MWKKTLSVLVLACLGMAASAAPDPRPGKLLDSIEEKYEVDPDDDYCLVWKFEDDGRSQMCFVVSETYTVAATGGGELEVREIWSPVCTRELAADEMRMLLEESYQRTLGFYALLPDGMVIFSARVPADCDAKTLMAAIEHVMVAADEMELLLTDEDKF